MLQDKQSQRSRTHRAASKRECRIGKRDRHGGMPPRPCALRRCAEHDLRGRGYAQPQRLRRPRFGSRFARTPVRDRGCCSHARPSLARVPVRGDGGSCMCLCMPAAARPRPCAATAAALLRSCAATAPVPWRLCVAMASRRRAAMAAARQRACAGNEEDDYFQNSPS
jgi:hypothetical protein